LKSQYRKNTFLVVSEADVARLTVNGTGLLLLAAVELGVDLQEAVGDVVSVLLLLILP